MVIGTADSNSIMLKFGRAKRRKNPPPGPPRKKNIYNVHVAHPTASGAVNLNHPKWGLLPSHAQIALLIGQIMEPEVYHDFKQHVNATVTGDPMETALSRELALGGCMQYFGEV